ncbi:MAG: PKD domain-containing protein, partial [Candidatus Brocadiales bacterium]|nr:PKD domain-containing protein [Candidatus Brocadiales bacterium]
MTLRRLFFTFALLTVICLTASAVSAKPPFPTISLPEKSQGERAIQALAGKLPEVAAWYGTTPQEFATMMIQDHTAWIDTEGRLFFIEDFPEPVVEGGASTLTEELFPYDQTFILHSRPGAKRVLFLDFDGHMTTGTAWNASYGDPIISPAYDTDGDRTSFSNTEMDRIQNVWRSVAEDYAPFDVDVTTEDPGEDAINRSSSTDDRYGTRVVMTVDDFAGCGCGGFAYVGIFDYVGDYYKPAFVFNTSEVGVAEAVSHEAGHNLGLSHDGVINGSSYYSGHGSGATGWAPIMGVGYYKQLVQWSKGEYANASNTQDDIQIIQNNGALLMADDHGNDQANSTALGYTTDGTTVSLNGTGLIERRTDIDFFHFISGNGNVSLTINPVPLSPNLDILAELYDANGFLIATSNPVDSLSASINETALPAGEYFISIDGIGKGDPLGTGYTDYASLGQYSISGSVPDPGMLQSPIAVATATPPLNGPAPFTLYLFGNESYDPDGSIQSYEWNFGDGSDNSLNSDPAHTYYAPGNYTATLTVVDNDGLSDSDTVSITVENKAPIAMASADFTSGTAPLTVNFDSIGSNDPDAPYGMITGYSWDFGDGVSSNTANPSHTYNSAGIFIVTLTVTDNFGDTGSDTVTINVSQPPAINQYPISENYVSGTVTGSYTNTLADDGVAESIRELESGGRPSKRYSYLEHVWVIPVQSGNSVALF